uniref:Uncharacterized protein n=1 Tax=Rhodnius prolixus TaxID=13249 RepID=T1HVM7_RHOPR
MQRAVAAACLSASLAATSYVQMASEEYGEYDGWISLQMFRITYILIGDSRPVKLNIIGLRALMAEMRVINLMDHKRFPLFGKEQFFEEDLSTRFSSLPPQGTFGVAMRRGPADILRQDEYFRAKNFPSIQKGGGRELSSNEGKEILAS